MLRSLLIIALVTGMVSAQDWARAKVEKSHRHREWVTVKHDGRNVWSEAGYRAAAPDLLSGMAPNGPAHLISRRAKVPRQ